MRRLATIAFASAALAACGRDDAVDGAFRAADSLRLNGRFAEALPRYATLKDSLVNADSGVRWRAHNGWAEALLRTGKLREAVAALDEARSLAGSDSVRQGRTRWARSLLLHRQGKLDSAVTEAREATRLAQVHGDRDLEVDAFSAQATAYSLSGRYRLAAAHAESALALERTLHRPPQNITVRFNNLGIEYRHLGRLTEAEQLFREGLETARLLPSRRNAMLLTANLANIRLMTGNVGEALRLREQAMSIAEDLQDAQGVVVSNGDIGDLNLVIGNHAAARRHFERSLQANTPVRYMYGKISALWGMGRLETAERNAAAAMRYLAEAMELADSGNWGREQSEIRASRALTAIVAGDAAAALRWADAALRLADSVDDVEARLRGLNARAAAREAASRQDAAEPYLEAIKLLESERGRIELGDLRMGVAEEYWHIYEGAIRTLVARGDAPGAFAVAERAKARMLLELMAERDASRAPESAAQALRERVRVLVEERGGARGDSAIAALDLEIQTAVDSLVSVEQRERMRDAGGAARYPTPAPLAEIRVGLGRGDPGRTLLEFFWGERDVYGWALRTHGLTARRLGSADSLAALIEFLRAALESPNSGIDWRAAAARAHATFIAPLSVPPASEVLVVADGPLAHLPFEVLLEATQRVTHGPSASVLLALATAKDSAWDRTALVVGDPSGRRAELPDLTRGANRLGPLPYAGAEAQAIYELFAPRADLLLRRDATLARWQQLDPSRYRYLHFAAHALVSDREPTLTHLVLADGALDLAAIRRLRLSAQLVSLSACETALGLRVRGEGVIGLPHAFLAAGARSVVVTLWRVDDKAAADLMTDFYRAVAAGRAPAEALRLARERRKDEHPSRWAAFILVGASQ